MSIPQKSARHSNGANPNVVRRQSGSLLGWRQQSERFQREAKVCYFVFRHPRARWYARAVAACTAAYLFSPIQLIPSFLPVVGFLDDFVVLLLGVKLLQRIIPSDVLAECRELADAVEIGKQDKIKLAALTLLWLFAAVAGSALMVKYILR
jgi:uncharacterized membrane protein YkvA (DUF1232 family)